MAESKDERNCEYLLPGGEDEIMLVAQIRIPVEYEFLVTCIGLHLLIKAAVEFVFHYCVFKDCFSYGHIV
ncbi:hypothetical protein LENED_006445 [Lentinula edodes]|uniref:Uncharacterized protein n=1 Tax=Lentinula edodes TaxID=5353 RepID=A0A1Q3EBP9_LENED|nr:hypothetical protein LENED_006445 [Lentinula edodes]